MKNKLYIEYVCCSGAHYYDRTSNKGTGEIAYDSCDGSRNLVLIERSDNCIKCTTKVCINDGR